jgi:long-chain fatty acid transport protein
MFLKCNSVGLFLALFIVAVSGNAFAGGSGVMRLELPDAAAVGKGSAFVGEANRASAVYYNPAGLTQIKNAEASVGITALAPQEQAILPSGEEINARRNTFVFPHVYFTTPVTENFYVGLGENSNFGSGHEWAADSPASFTRYSMIESSFENKDWMLVGAYKANDQWSFAVGADLDDSKLSKRKKLAQANGIEGDSLLKADDAAWGFRLSTLFKVNERHQFGLQYRSPISHEYEGKLYFNNLNASPTFGGPSYVSVFGDTTFETKARYKIVMPQSVVLGYSFKPTNKWTFNADLEWLDWSRTEQSLISFPDVNATQASVLATNNPQARDWKSVWSGNLGLEYAIQDNLRVRGGYAYHQSPVPEDTWDTAFADSNSHSFATGLGYDISSNLTIDLAYVAVFYETRDINNSVDSGFGANLDNKYKSFVNIGMATLTYKF